MSNCTSCHRDVMPGARFCPFCAAPIAPPQAEGAAPDPLIGQTFKGMYFIQQRIGGGGMGDVYKALHVNLEVPVALKILKRALLSDPTVVQRFHREARAASRLRHTNVINVTDFGQTEDGTLYMAMEYVAGKSLARVIAEEFPLPERRVVRIGEQILAALVEAHAGQILHRDLKPENVMLESRRGDADRVKVLDFGIAKIQMPGDGGSPTLTQAGLVCGTPGYMSPEQWSGHDLDARCDLYSVGVILYEMLTGKLPFEAETPLELVRKHLTEKPVPPGRRDPAHPVSPDLDAFVMRALSADRGARHPGAEEMRADLLACVLQPEPDASAEPRASPRTVVLPGRASRTPAKSAASPAPTAALERAGAPIAVAVAASEKGATPAATERLLTPAIPTPPRASGARDGAPTGPRPAERRRTPAPHHPAARHEMDQEEEGEPAAPPHRRSRVPLIAGGAGAAVLVAAGIVYLLARPPLSTPSLPAREPGPSPAPTSVAAPVPAPTSAPAPVPEAAHVPGPARAPQAVPEADHAPKPKPPPRPRPAAHESRALLFSFALPRPASGKGVLSIRAEPSGTGVFVNGVAYGEPPRELLVPAGAYDVRVTSRHGTQRTRMTVEPGKRALWTAIFSAR